jgi:hypothetical protein
MEAYDKLLANRLDRAVATCNADDAMEPLVSVLKSTASRSIVTVSDSV